MAERCAHGRVRPGPPSAFCLMPALLAILAPVAAFSTTFNVPGDFPTIQQAMDSASPGDTVLVAPGTYTGQGNRDLSFGGKDIVVRSSAGADDTIISCQLGGRGFLFTGGETEAAVLDGFTVTDAVVVTAGDGGAGISCSNASPVIRNCRLTRGLVAEGSGAGIDCYGGAPLIEGCVIESNDVFGGYGGGISCRDSSPIISDCSIMGNRADRGAGVSSQGGGLRLQDSEVASNRASSMGLPENPQGAGIHATSGIIERCLIRDNEVIGGEGGGFYGDAFLAQCVITGNHSQYAEGSSGGGAFCGASTYILECTITGNLASLGGDGVLADGTTMERTIVWGNQDCGIDVTSEGADVTLICCSYGTIEGPTLFIGDQLTEDPLFCDAQPCWLAPTNQGSYGLQSQSPCLPENSPCGLIIGALPEQCDLSDAPDRDASLPAAPISLGAPSPNPTRGPVTCEITTAVETPVQVGLFDVLGRRVDVLLDEVLKPGVRSLRWNPDAPDGRTRPRGVYYLRAFARGTVLTRKVILLD